MDVDLDPIVRVRVVWQVHPDRVTATRSGATFACNARFPDKTPVDLFSVVLSWPGSSPDEVRLRLLVPSGEMGPVAERLRPGEVIEITEGYRTIGTGMIEATDEP